jgi:hypothetical protein
MAAPTSRKMKYVLVSGGVISGVGKGIIGEQLLSVQLPISSNQFSFVDRSVAQNPGHEDMFSLSQKPWLTVYTSRPSRLIPI